MTFIHIMAACLTLAFFANPAVGNMVVFGWRSPEGTYEFTDDINRVPVAHLHSVQRIEVDGLVKYRYYTGVKTVEGHKWTTYEAVGNAIAENLDEKITEDVEKKRRDKRHRNPNKR